jgi:two-component system, NarL family, invasion response regulator UvrY
MIRVALADDHMIVRRGLKQILGDETDFTVVAEADNGNDTLRLVRETAIDVLVLDMSMPGRSGIELIKLIKDEKPRLPILVLSMHAEEQYAVRAIKAGAAGYLNKDSAADQLVSAIRKVAGGGAYIGAPQAAGPSHTYLSDREFQVFERLVAGKNVTAIADSLAVSAKTVSTHKARILQKMRMASAAELIHYAIQQGLTDRQ